MILKNDQREFIGKFGFKFTVAFLYFIDKIDCP